MRPADAAEARQIAARVRLRKGDAPSIDPKIVATIEEAVRHRRVVHLTYTDAHGTTTLHRPVEVTGLHLTTDDAYLIGWCRLRDDGRVFRLDRIGAIRLTDDTAPTRDLDAVLDVPFSTITPD
jgi:predicted DNA-binding transcriptional regulator YafY